jgi:hypothetical protein
VELNFGATQNPLDSMTIMYVLEKSRKNGVLACLLERLKKIVLVVSLVTDFGEFYWHDCCPTQTRKKKKNPKLRVYHL